MTIVFYDMEPNNTLQIGTASGTLLSIAPNIVSEDIVKTIVLAVVGAIVSFVVSIILERILGKRRK